MKYIILKDNPYAIGRGESEVIASIDNEGVIVPIGVIYVPREQSKDSR